MITNDWFVRLIQPQKYFWKILTTIGVVSIVFQLITLSTLAYFMVVPLGQRATDDLANVMVHAAETWYSLSDNSVKKAFIDKMKHQHNLLMTDADKPLPVRNNHLPYLYFLEHSLNKQLGQQIPIRQSQENDDEQWFWADIPVSGNTVRFGFPRSRIGVNPPAAFFLLITIGLYLTVITAVVLTRRLTIPIERLHQAAQAVGKGQWPEPVLIEGPEELNVLAREFNRMNIQVRELLSNRTTLLAGIAHDLRTPLTQIQLALSMLPNDGGDPKLMDSIQNDLDAINRLIDETLSISLELEEGEKELTDIGQEVSDVVAKVKPGDMDIQINRHKPCHQVLHPLALRRILTNLLVNAIRYGDNKPISVNCNCDDDAIIIQITDQGVGIPSDQVEAVFRPFYRLEKSRGSKTGGSGLGLAIVRQLADANKWSVQLLPRPGGGTKAVLTIPRNEPDTRIHD